MNNVFLGKINGKDVKTLNKMIDYNKTSLKDRQKVVNNIIKSGFYEEYFDNNYKCIKTTKSSLSEEDNICQSLERLANYLLNSDEIKEEDKKNKIEYVFHTSASYFKGKMDKEQSIESKFNITEENGGADTESKIVHMFTNNSSNHKIIKDLEVKKSDINENSEMGKILKSYNSFLNDLDKSTTDKYFIDKHKGMIKKDMLDVKNAYIKPIIFNGHISESTVYDYEVFDFTNEKHLLGAYYIKPDGTKSMAKGLLYFDTEFVIENEMSFVVMDLQNTIKKANLNEKEKEILKCFRENYKNSEIIEELSINRYQLYCITNAIVNKIKSVNDKYDLRKENSNEQ